MSACRQSDRILAEQSVHSFVDGDQAYGGPVVSSATSLKDKAHFFRPKQPDTCKKHKSRLRRDSALGKKITIWQRQLREAQEASIAVA